MRRHRRRLIPTASCWPRGRPPRPDHLADERPRFDQEITGKRDSIRGRRPAVEHSSRSSSGLSTYTHRHLATASSSSPHEKMRILVPWSSREGRCRPCLASPSRATRSGCGTSRFPGRRTVLGRTGRRPLPPEQLSDKLADAHHGGPSMRTGTLPVQHEHHRVGFAGASYRDQYVVTGHPRTRNEECTV